MKNKNEPKKLTRPPCLRQGSISAIKKHQEYYLYNPPLSSVLFRIRGRSRNKNKDKQDTKAIIVCPRLMEHQAINR